MRAAYVDTSSVLSVYMLEPGHRGVLNALSRYDRLLSSNLLEAELRSALHREALEAPDRGVLGHIVWVLPDRPLTSEIASVLAAGYLRGADLWHLACALYTRGRKQDLDLMTLDQRQRRVAQRLGFRVI